MIALLKTAERIQVFLNQTGLKFCFIGGLAVVRWGPLRFTNDVDLTLYTGFVNDELIINKVLSRYQSRIDNPMEFALTKRILLLNDSENNITIDLSLGGMPFEERMISRSSLFEFQKELFIRTCSAEDLIVMKVFAGRERDWGDVRGILDRNQNKLNFEIIISELKELVEIIPEKEINLRKLQNMMSKT